MSYRRTNVFLRICCLLTAALVTVKAPAYVSGAAGETPEIIYEQYFNSTATNGVPDEVTVKGEKARVIRAGENNKVLQVLSGAKTEVSFPVSSEAFKYVAEFSIAAEKSVNTSVSLQSGTSQYELLKIEDNAVRTTEGKTVGGVIANAAVKNGEMSGRMSRIAIAVNRESGIFSVYIDSKMCLYDWKLPNAAKADGITVTKAADENNNLYLDNVAAYEGEEPLSAITPTGGYNSDGKEFFSYTDDLGDFTFFHSTWTGQNKYANNIKLYPKTNEITSEAFDYKNPKKGDKLIFKKLSNDDAYMDIQCNIFKGYDSRKQYKFFKISGEFMCDFNGGGSAQLFMLRDSTSSSATISEYPVKVESDGSVSLPGGIRFADAAAGGNCFKITMYLNLEDKTTTVLFGTGDDWKYNNFKMVTKEVPLTNKLSSLNIVRISCGAGAFTGEMQCRNVEVTGLDKEFIIGDSDVTEVATSMFDFDKDMAKDLDGKICFGYRVNSVFANGERYKLADEAVYTDNEFYISAEEFNKAYNVDAAVSGSNISYNGKTFAPKRIITADNGKALIPLKETAAELLSLNAFDDEEGLIVTSAQKIYFDKSAEVPYHKRYTPEDPWSNHYRYIDRPSDLQALYDYMMFDRPTSEQLLNGYRKMTADGKHHISVLATDKDFERIRELAKTDGYMKKVTDDLIAQADAVIKQKIRTYKYDDNFRTLNTARQLESWMQLVGFAYQITGEAKYAQYAMDQLTELKNFPDLNPIHIIDSGSYGTAIAVAYDWCYDYFTEEQREEIKETAYRLFLSVFPQAFYSRIPAKSVTSNDLTIVMPSICLKWYSNFNTWVNSGGVCMAAAFMGEYPEICSDYLSNSIRSLEYTMKNLYPDGVWAESSNYWYHVARSLMYACGTLENIYGTEFNILSFPGCEETGIANMTIRSMVANYNYHDASDEKIYASHPMGYFGKHFNQRELLAARRATIEKSFDDRMADVQVFVADALYYDPSVKVDEIEKLPRVKYSEGVELFSVHGDYKDYDALFFAAHGGPTTFYHAHNDNGDFVFDLNGVRWAYALGPEDYNSTLAESAKYRKRTEGHNTITINNSEGYNQLDSVYNPIIKSEEGTGGAYAVYDMAPAYADADSFKRGFYIGDNFKTLTVRDEIELNKDNSEIYWFMHTTAEAYVTDDKTVVLSKDGETLVLNFETDADTAEVSIMDAAPLPNSPAGEGQNVNSGVRKIAIRLQASGKVSLTVRLGEFGGAVRNEPIDQWAVPEKTAEQEDAGDYGYTGYVYGLEMDGMGYVPVVSTKSFPEFKIIPHDPEKTAEIIASDSLEVPNLVRIYNSDRTRSKTYIIPYDAQRGIKDLAYEEMPIANFSVSAEPQAENRGANMFDNDFSTRWTTLNKGESAVFDLGSVQNIDGIAAGFWQSPVRNYYFDLYYSNDKVNWTKIDSYTSASGAEEYQVFSFDRINAQYLKLVGNGCSANVNTNILELRVLKRKAAFEHVAADGKSHFFEITMTA